MNICNSCFQECNPKRVDFGIGPYEYWGSRETQVDIHTVSDCCESDFSESELDEELDTRCIYCKRIINQGYRIDEKDGYICPVCLNRTTCLVKELVAKGHEIEHSHYEQLEKRIEFIGEGWYSLDDVGVFRFDLLAKIPTYSRIRVIKKG